METKKEQWIEETFNSLNELNRTPLSDRLKQRLEAIPTRNNPLGTKIIPLKAVWLAAASIAVLITLNITVFQKVSASDKQESSIYSDYFSYLDSI